MTHPLDNPVWNALSSKLNHFNLGNDLLKYFPPEVSPFIALKDWNEEDIQHLITYIPQNRSFSVLLHKEIRLPGSFEMIFKLPLYQMHSTNFKPYYSTEISIRPLTIADVPQMLSLTDLTKPGPFYQKTIEFGNYYGIFNEEELVAMAGERLQMDGYTEISAICTKPEHQGKGYAAHLFSQAAERILQNACIPFLHVRTDNLRAIELYKRSGFEIRTDIHFAVFKKR